jgi:hypothetical protein
VRFLLLLVIIGVAAYFTVPTREAHEAAAQAFLEGKAQEQGLAGGADQAPAPGLSLDGVVDFVTGMVAGQGRYESWYVASKYTVDMPGSAYLECYGAFTFVRCSEAGSDAAAS